MVIMMMVVMRMVTVYFVVCDSLGGDDDGFFSCPTKHDGVGCQNITAVCKNFPMGGAMQCSPLCSLEKLPE